MAERTATSTYRIAVVDDCPELRRLIRFILQASPMFEVCAEGGSGRDAVAIAEQQRPDVMLLDLSMPDMDGLEALPNVLSASPDTRVVLFSGFEGGMIGDRALELGAAAYLEKDVGMSSLPERLLHVLGANGQPAESSTAPTARPRPPAPTVDVELVADHVERFRTAFEEAGIGMVTLSLSQRLVRANRSFAAMLGRSEESLVGVPLALIVPGHALPATVAMLSTLISGERATCQLELTLRHADERELVALVTVSTVSDSAGRPLYLFLQAQDITARNHAEARFRGLLESAPDAMVIVGVDGLISLINRQTEQLFGYDRGELLGQPIEMLVPERFRDRHLGHRDGYIQHASTRPMGAQLELFGRRRDGSEFPVEISLSPLETDEGVLISAAVRDITERRRAEERFRGLLEAAPDAMVIVGADGLITLINRQTEQLFGYDRGELLGQPIEMLVPERFRDRHLGHRAGYLQHASLRPMGADLLLAGRRRDGSEFPVEISLSPLHTDQGMVTSAAVRDITDRRRAEEAAGLLAAIVDSADDAILGKLPDGTITSWNAGAERMYGYTTAEAVGQNVNMLAPTDRVDEVAAMLDALNQGSLVDHLETVRQRKDGSLVNVSLTISPIKDPFGHIVGASTISRDISDRVAIEHQLQQQASELARSNAELEQFAYVASHDLQNPLHTIQGFNALLAQQLPEDAGPIVAQCVTGIESCARQMSALIERLLKYAHVGREPLQTQQVNCAEVVEEALSGMRARIEERGAVITVGELPTVLAEPVQLQQVFANLIGNAIKFVPEDRTPQIEVFASRINGDWTFTVRDNGLGIPAERRATVFERFHRLHDTTTYPGTGLGLAICDKIVTRHGGTIWAQESPQGGCDFSFTLPQA